LKREWPGSYPSILYAMLLDLSLVRPVKRAQL